MLKLNKKLIILTLIILLIGIVGVLQFGNLKEKIDLGEENKQAKTGGISEAEKIYNEVANTSPKNMTEEILEENEKEENIEEGTSDDEFSLYENEEMRFSLKHPSYLEAEVLPDGYISFYLEGPTQAEDTEFFDGINLAMISIPLEDESVKEAIERERENMIDIYGEEGISQIDPIEIDGNEGYIFNDNFAQYIFVNQGTDKYLQIMNMTSDPGDLGYKQIAFEMIKSIKILD